MISFQQVVHWWCLTCHGKERTQNVKERALRFTEESIELAQIFLTKEDVLKMVEYVYSRSTGEAPQEVGGVVITLAALCTAIDIDIAKAYEIEIERVWRNIDKIREKQKSKISAQIGE